ncbi:MAG TPA: hypothetical protein VF175_15685 [Lacipirellula sp.]
MALRVIAAAAISAVLMFFWGFVYWGPVLNMTSQLMATLPEDTALDVVAPLRGGNLPDGMYVYPGPVKDMHDETALSEWEKKLEEGPVFHMAYHQAGVSPMDPVQFAMGLAHSFVIALLAGILLATVVHGLPTYASRVGVLLLVSIIAAIWTNVGSVIWWFHPAGYAAGQIVYEVVAGLLMALVTAGIVRPREMTTA